MSVAWTYLIACLPQIWIFTQKVEALVKQKNIVVSLITAPFTFRV